MTTMLTRIRALTMAVSVLTHGACGNFGEGPEGNSQAALGQTSSATAGDANAEKLGKQGITEATCAPQDAFSYALCVCDDLTDVGELWVGNGPSGRGSVGVNRGTVFANRAEIEGDVVTGGNLIAYTDSWIGGNVHVRQNAKLVGRANIKGSLAVGEP